MIRFRRQHFTNDKRYGLYGSNVSSCSDDDVTELWGKNAASGVVRFVRTRSIWLLQKKKNFEQEHLKSVDKHIRSESEVRISIRIRLFPESNGDCVVLRYISLILFKMKIRSVLFQKRHMYCQLILRPGGYKIPPHHCYLHVLSLSLRDKFVCDRKLNQFMTSLPPPAGILHP